MADYCVRIRGKTTADDGLRLDLGPLQPGQAWWHVPLPACPDCGGDLVWFEAGYVPGARKCLGQPTFIEDDPGSRDGKRRGYDADGGCGSMFSVTGDEGRVSLERLKFY